MPFETLRLVWFEIKKTSAEILHNLNLERRVVEIFVKRLLKTRLDLPNIHPRVEKLWLDKIVNITTCAELIGAYGELLENISKYKTKELEGRDRQDIIDIKGKYIRESRDLLILLKEQTLQERVSELVQHLRTVYESIFYKAWAQSLTTKIEIIKSFNKDVKPAIDDLISLSEVYAETFRKSFKKNAKKEERLFKQLSEKLKAFENNFEHIQTRIEVIKQFEKLVLDPLESLSKHAKGMAIKTIKDMREAVNRLKTEEVVKSM